MGRVFFLREAEGCCVCESSPYLEIRHRRGPEVVGTSGNVSLVQSEGLRASSSWSNLILLPRDRFVVPYHGDEPSSELSEIRNSSNNHGLCFLEGLYNEVVSLPSDRLGLAEVLVGYFHFVEVCECHEDFSLYYTLF